MPNASNNSNNTSRQEQDAPATRRLATVRRGRSLSSKKVTRDVAIAMARRILLKGGKLDMASLASRLGIGRATLYRWTGDRERLINKVFLTFLQDTFEWIEHRVNSERLAGAEAIARAVEYMMLVLTRSKAVKSLLHNEPDVALRVLTDDSAGSLQGITTKKLIAIIEAEVAKGVFTPRLEVDLLAYTIVRLVDSIVYGDMIAGAEVNHGAANKVIRSLL